VAAEKAPRAVGIAALLTKFNVCPIDNWLINSKRKGSIVFFIWLVDRFFNV
jgi:hypothetical protein